MKKKMLKKLIGFELNWSLATPYSRWLAQCHGPHPGPLKAQGSSAIHSVNKKKHSNFHAKLWQGWRPDPDSIAGAGTGSPGLCWDGIPGHGQGGQGHEGRECPRDWGTFSKTLPVTTRYKYGIENIIFSFYHIGSSMHPYLQDMKRNRGLWRILKWCTWLSLFSFTRQFLFKLLHFIDASSKFCSCLNLIVCMPCCSFSSFWLCCLIHFSDSSK